MRRKVSVSDASLVAQSSPSAKIRVAFNALTLPGNPAGIAYYAAELANHLPKADPAIEVVFFTNTESALALVSNYPNLSFRIAPCSSVWAKVLYSQFVLPWLIRDFHLVHSVGNVAIVACPIPQVVTIHDIYQKHFPNRFGFIKRAYLNSAIWLTSRLDARIISVSQNTTKDLVHFYPHVLNKIITVSSASKFKPEAEEAGPRKDFLFVGTLEPGKNLELAILALHRLQQNFHFVKKLYVVGAKGWKQSHISGMVDSLGLKDNVLFLGYVNDGELRNLFKSVECLVFPSRYEGFGLPILEAQALGCPVISADNSSLREVGGLGCCYFKDNDLDDLVKKLKYSQEFPDTFSALRNLGFENLRRFSWTKSAQETLRIYLATARPIIGMSPISSQGPLE